MASRAASTPEYPLPLLPEPESVTWGVTPEEEWVTLDPFGEVKVGVNEDLPHTQYSVSINPSGASISAGSEAALADGRNAFAQIVHLSAVRSSLGSAATLTDASDDTASRKEAYRIPKLTMSDAPQRAWRGVLLDPARHFIALKDLRRLIDVMAIYRLNVLQLNLTDDQGWRFEVQGYPRLTEVAAFRERTVEGVPAFDDTDTYAEDHHGGFYTQAELRELAEFARERGITLVPGINLPGHCQAAIAAYPNLGNFPEHTLSVRETWSVSQHILGTHDVAFQFVRDVLEQVADVFDSPFVHIGGEDVPLTEWSHSAEARTNMDAWGYTRESEILQRFLSFSSEVLAQKNKRVVVCHADHLVRIPDNAVVLEAGSRSDLSKALKRGFQTVAASRLDLGLDHVQGATEPVGLVPALPLESVLKENVLPGTLKEDEQKLLLGMQAVVYGEFVPTATHLEYMLFPRLIAIAQRAWGAKELKPAELKERIKAHEPLLAHLGVESRKVDPTSA